MSDIRTVAEAFAGMLKANQHLEAAERFNAADIISMEAMPGPMEICRGTAELRAKGDWWYQNHEIHAFTAEGPLICGDQFLMRFHVDVTRKENGQRVAMDEFGLYTVRDGKIVEERFFYPTA